MVTKSSSFRSLGLVCCMCLLATYFMSTRIQSNRTPINKLGKRNLTTRVAGDGGLADDQNLTKQHLDTDNSKVTANQHDPTKVLHKSDNDQTPANQYDLTETMLMSAKTVANHYDLTEARQKSGQSPTNRKYRTKMLHKSSVNGETATNQYEPTKTIKRSDTVQTPMRKQSHAINLQKSDKTTKTSKRNRNDRDNNGQLSNQSSRSKKVPQKLETIAQQNKRYHLKSGYESSPRKQRVKSKRSRLLPKDKRNRRGRFKSVNKSNLIPNNNIFYTNSKNADGDNQGDDTKARLKSRKIGLPMDRDRFFTDISKKTVDDKREDNINLDIELIADKTLSDTRRGQPRKETRRSKKVMLMLTPAFESRFWWDTPVNYDMTQLDGSPCPERRCEVTYDRTRFKDSDLVFFHGRDVRVVMPIYFLELRAYNADQIWVWAFMESPVNLFYDPTYYNGLFNWTATYRSDSDLWTPYYKIVTLSNKNMQQTTHTTSNKQQNFAKGKSRMVVATMSNYCDSFRMGLIGRLSRYVSLDLYGGCNKDMPEQNQNVCKRGSEKCQSLMSTYKFIMAIENTICDQYVTEKYYESALLHGLVPIVAISSKTRREDVYKTYVPGSYINILDFKNTRALANHLTYLNGNDTAYSQYFSWKRKYKIVKGPHRACLACQKLWRDEEKNDKRRSLLKKKRSSYRLSEFWSRNKCDVFDKEDEHDLFAKYV